MIRTAVFTLFSAATLLTTIQAQAVACSCVAPPPPKDALAAATAVFEGKVTAIETVEGRKQVTFKVSRTWKGVTSEAVVVHTPTSSAACGFAFEKDKPYLVYCFGKADTGLQTNLCTRTAAAEAAKTDYEELGDGKEIGSEE